MGKKKIKEKLVLRHDRITIWQIMTFWESGYKSYKSIERDSQFTYSMHRKPDEILIGDRWRGLFEQCVGNG